MADPGFAVVDGELTCEICYCDQPAAEVGLLACKHQYCAACLAQTFKTQLGKGGPKCPEPKCGRKATVDELRTIIEHHMEPELITMLEDMQTSGQDQFTALI